MPTYTNEGTSPIIIEGTDGHAKTLKPGESGESYKTYTITGLTQTAATPYFNPVIAHHESTNSSGVGATDEITIDPTTRRLRLSKVSSGITVCLYLADEANTPPAILDHAEDDPIIDVVVDPHDFPGTVILKYSDDGSCVLSEFKE